MIHYLLLIIHFFLSSYLVISIFPILLSAYRRVGIVHVLTVKLNNSLRFSTKTEIVLFLLVIFIEDGLLLVPAGLLSRLEMCDDHARQHHNNQN